MPPRKNIIFPILFIAVDLCTAQPEQWTIPIVNDEHGILCFGDPFEQNETAQEQSPNDKPQLMGELPLSTDFFQEVESELSAPHASQQVDQDIESLSADLSHSVFTLIYGTQVHQNMAKPEAHLHEAPSTLSQETVLVGTSGESSDIDLGTLLAYGDLGPLSINDINAEALSLDTDIELLNDIHQFGNELMTDAKQQPNTSDPLSQLQTPVALSDPINEKDQYVDEERDRKMAVVTFGKSVCGHSAGSVAANSRQGFLQPDNFNYHFVNHNVEKPYQCNEYDSQLCTSSNDRRHQRTSNGERTPQPSQGDLCQKKFSDRNGCQRGQRKHMGERPFQCDFCQKNFIKVSHYLEHRRIHTGERPFQCDTCPKQFRTSSHYKRHRRIHTGEKRFQCDICLNQFRSSDNYKTHRFTHIGERPYQCDICTKQFSSSSNYKKHRRTHKEKKTFQCDTCLKQFCTSFSYRTHRRTHAKEKPFLCDICPKQFRTSGSYHKHRQTHIKEKSFQCDICPKRFHTSTEYKVHRRIHTGEKPFQCDICGKQFSTSGGNQRHRRTHTGEKRFQCDICSKQFGSSGDSQRHRRTHTGEKPFHCDICGKQFSSSSDNQRHRRTHTGEKRFPCDLC